jgi:hypothetical protein
MTIAVLGIDLGKNSCSLVGLDAGGKVVLRRRMRRRPLSPSGPSWRPAWSPWKPAAAPTTWVVPWPLRDTPSG